MKAYLLRFEFEDSNPLIWREVWIPAGYTFAELHDVIQYTTNFTSGYPNRGFHPFDFYFPLERLRITDVTAGDYLYLANMFKYKDATQVTYDTYFEHNNEFMYTYDFEDVWKIQIRVLDIDLNYKYDYVYLKDGSGTAPPEEVGGMSSYHSFLNILKDDSHPEHDSICGWLESRQYEEFGVRSLRQKLRKQTLNKRNKEDTLDYLILDYVFYLIEYFGVVPYKLFIELFYAHNNYHLTEELLDAFLEKKKSYINKLSVIADPKRKIIYADILDYYNKLDLILLNPNKLEHYKPSRRELLSEHNGSSYEKSNEFLALMRYVTKEFFPRQITKTRKVCDQIQYSLRVGLSKNDLRGIYRSQGILFKTEKQEHLFWIVVDQLDRMTIKWWLNGHSPLSLQNRS